MWISLVALDAIGCAIEIVLGLVALAESCTGITALPGERIVMSHKLEEAFHQAMLDLYARARDEVGYRAGRFLQSVRRNGGVEAAKRLLKPRKSDTSKGLDALLSATRPDLTVEFLVLRPEYIGLSRRRSWRKPGGVSPCTERRLRGAPLRRCDRFDRRSFS